MPHCVYRIFLLILSLFLWTFTTFLGYFSPAHTQVVHMVFFIFHLAKLQNVELICSSFMKPPNPFIKLNGKFSWMTCYKYTWCTEYLFFSYGYWLRHIAAWYNFHLFILFLKLRWVLYTHPVKFVTERNPKGWRQKLISFLKAL